MSALDQAVAAILADPLAGARAAPRAIGYVGLEIPDDLLAASGRYALHLPWSADRATPRADTWLESSFSGASRAILEDWAEGRFDFLEAVLFTRGEDSAQRLYYYVCELQRRGEIGGPEPLIFDVAKVPRPTSLRRTGAALALLADRLGIDAAALAGGIAAVDRRRDWFARLRRDRSGAGSRYERIARAALFAPLEGFAPDEPGEPVSGPRILFAGSSPPDDRLHLTVEQAGGNIVAEMLDRSLDRLGTPIGAVDDPFAALAEFCHRAPLGPRSFVDRACRLVEACRSAAADAAIVWLAEEDESLVWHVPAQQRALAEAGLPALFLTDRRWDGGDGAGDEIAAFVQELSR